jgi:hypothetical protein
MERADGPPPPRVRITNATITNVSPLQITHDTITNVRCSIPGCRDYVVSITGNYCMRPINHDRPTTRDLVATRLSWSDLDATQLSWLNRTGWPGVSLLIFYYI